MPAIVNSVELGSIADEVDIEAGDEILSESISHKEFLWEIDSDYVFSLLIMFM